MTAACGLDCDVCGLKRDKKCGGCVPGTHPKALERSEEIKEIMGAYCPAMKCAAEKKEAYCPSCDEFPCKVLYKWEIPYSKKLLDLIGKSK